MYVIEYYSERKFQHVLLHGRTLRMLREVKQASYKRLTLYDSIYTRPLIEVRSIEA